MVARRTQNPDGTVTLANSYTYSTWGTPTTTVAGGFSDLGLRFLYVGASDVQWDNSFGLGLLYMHARHYSPASARFLQPDPDHSERNLYAYAGNSPITQTDPSGRFNRRCWELVFGALLIPRCVKAEVLGDPAKCRGASRYWAILY